jgi:ankyrin repeat protein
VTVEVVGLLAWSVLALTATDTPATDLRLVEAVRNQDRRAVHALLKQRVDVNARQGDGATALHWAVHLDDLETTSLLIRAGARVDVSNDLGVTPLGLASNNGNPAIVDRLLAAGADPNAVAGGEPVIMTAARSGNVDVVKSLLTRGANVNLKDSSRGQTALMWAVAYRHPAVVRILIEHGADVHARSTVTREIVMRGNRYGGVVSQQRAVTQRAVGELEQGGSTALLFAARHGEVESARLLIAAGADVNVAAPDGTSALVMASHGGHGALASFLLGAGAEPNDMRAGYAALHAAVLRGDLQLVRALIAKRADVNARLITGTASRRYSKDFAFNAAWVGATPFWLAARFVEPAIMRELAGGGADPHLVPKDGTTAAIAAVAAGIDSGPSASDARERRLDPLELAERSNRHHEFEQQALEAVRIAVDLGVDVRAVNSVGDTALHQASSKGFVSVVQFLAERGADVNARNKRGQTPLSVITSDRSTTEDIRQQRTADLLRKLGAEE